MASRFQCVACEAFEISITRPIYCPQCGRLETMIEPNTLVSRGPKPASEVVDVSPEKFQTGEAPLDSLLHGGLIRPSTAIIWGDAGVGKTRSVTRWATHIGKTHLISLEMPEGMIKKVVKEAGANMENLFISEEDDIFSTKMKFDCLVYDSLHYTTRKKPIVLHELEQWAKKNKGIVFLIGHRNGKGQLSGPKGFEHWPDYLFNMKPHAQQEIKLKIFKARHAPRGETVINLL